MTGNPEGGPIALVTGANKGLGREIARQLGARGASVLLGARDARRGELAAEALAAEGIDAPPLPLDVTDPAGVADAAATIDGRYGRLEIVVDHHTGHGTDQQRAQRGHRRRPRQQDRDRPAPRGRPTTLRSPRFHGPGA
ncbi:hypothetical protein B5181_20370 [Streptomyces sp. 4F]|nr:hypothetical protein B5181_20370 [Streptomyces sp. 4F]